MIHSYTIFASTYNCSVYGGGSYSSSEACATTTQTSTYPNTPNTAGVTGQSVIGGLAAGLILVVVSVAIFIQLHRKRRKS